MENFTICPTCKAHVDIEAGLVLTSKCLELINKILNDPLLTNLEKEKQSVIVREEYLLTADEFKSKVCNLRYAKLDRKCLLEFK